MAVGNRGVQDVSNVLDFLFLAKPLFMEIYTVYVISNPDGIYYKGYTADLVRRLEQHNSPLGKYTSDRGSWKLVFIRSFEDKSKALKYEKMLKRQNHKYLNWLINLR